MRHNYLKLLFIIAATLCITFSKQVWGQPGCPGIDAGPDITIACGTPCTTLTANVVPAGTTTSYAVQSVPYAPPYPYNTGTPILVNIDDRWSNVINLPFTFCYYNNNYTQIVAGSNGLISFNLTYANNFCPWSFTATVPNSNLPLNSIFGPYHDIDPGVGGSMYYAILGTFPCRTYVVNWHNVPMFSCNSMIATHQIVIYESTNIIEVYMQNKPLCSSWNSGNAVIGMQNNTGTTGIAAPGRNTSAWTAQNEAWRIYPTGPGGFSVNWYEMGNPTSLGTGTSVQVCPTDTTTYIAEVVYNLCTGTTLTLTDTVTVNYDAAFNLSVNPTSASICAGESVTITASAPSNVTFTWSPSTGLNTTTGNTVIATPGVTTTYTVTGVDNTNCSMTVPVTIQVTPLPIITFDPPSAAICDGEAVVLSVSGADSFSWSPPGGLSSLTDSVVSANPSITTTYIVVGNTNGCTGQAGVNVVVGTAANIYVYPPNPNICEGTSVQLQAFGAVDYSWSPDTGLSAVTGNIVTAAPLATTTYTVVGNPNGCTGSETVTVTVSPIPDVDFTAFPTEGCEPLHVMFLDNSFPAPVSWAWTFGDGTGPNPHTDMPDPEYMYQEYGTYDVTLLVTTDGGCQAWLTIPQMITVYRTPIANFSAEPEQTWIMEPEIHFYDQSYGADKWYWNFGEPNWSDNLSNDQNPTHMYHDTGSFAVMLAVASDYGCVDTVKKTVYIAPLVTFYIPNAFTPNSDGVNDEFTFYGKGIDEGTFVIRIFDRWGQQVYFSKDIYQGWDGKFNNSAEVAPPGVYSYKLSFKDYKALYHEHKGIVTLIR